VLGSGHEPSFPSPRRMSAVWVVATLLAAGFQVARNGLQRSLMPQSGPWGATLVRFLFGLPFSVLFVTAATPFVPAAHLHPSAAFWLTVGLGAVSQVVATASLLVAMRRAGFTVATALQQSSLPLAALIGLAVFHDSLHPSAWAGVALTTAGLVLLTWPGRPSGPQPLSGAGFGLLSGLTFGFSLNAFRHAGLILEPAHPLVAAIVTVCVVQAMQAVVLGGVLLAVSPMTVRVVLRNWRQSLGAGLCGSLASSGWFMALALAPAASVRAVGVIEAPMAAFAGHRLFQERLHVLQWVAGAAVAAGVVLTALN
jgi:drug/metabolite transporter (DMT)-like permease